jgi:hypothetical protein
MTGLRLPVCLLVVVGGVLLAVPAAAPSPQDEVPAGGYTEPGVKEPEIRCDPPPIGKRGRDFESESWGQKLCGTDDGDGFTARAGSHHIEGFRGDDNIVAVNGYPDEKIWGGPGRDTGTFDKCDRGRIKGVEKMNFSKSRCTPKPKPRRRTAALTYPFWQPTVECGLGAETGRPRIRFVHEPLIRAADTTANVDWQTVAWSGLLYKWDGEQWVFRGQTNWLWDRTYDEQVEAFPGHYWRRLDRPSNERWFVSFNPTEPGVYRVAIRYYWYAAPLAPRYTFVAWASTHYGPAEFEDHPAHRWCVFPSSEPAPPPPAPA